MFVKLNLPSPSTAIVNEISRIVLDAPLEMNLKKLHDGIQDYKINAVSRKFIEDDQTFNDLVYHQYTQYFNHKFFPAVGIVNNVFADKIACWPPHSDRTRIFALNYYLQEGGDNVQTVMYKTHDNYDSGIGTGKIYKYQDLAIDKIYHLRMKQWYALNARQAHSIENIVSRRIIFTLSFHNISFFEFCEYYKDFVMEEENYIIP